MGSIVDVEAILHFVLLNDAWLKIGSIVDVETIQ